MTDTLTAVDTVNSPIFLGDAYHTPSVCGTAHGVVALLVDRIETRIDYLANMGRFVRGSTVTDAKAASAEISGMIDAFDSVTVPNHLTTRLHVERCKALATALDRLRRK